MRPFCAFRARDAKACDEDPRRRRQWQQGGANGAHAKTACRCSRQAVALGTRFDQRGSSLAPIRNSSTARAHCRPSRMAQTTSDWPRRMSPAANTFGTLVA